MRAWVGCVQVVTMDHSEAEFLDMYSRLMDRGLAVLYDPDYMHPHGEEWRQHAHARLHRTCAAQCLACWSAPA